MSKKNYIISVSNSIITLLYFCFQLVDLHVYIVPPDIWREQYNNLLNQNVTETISAGIIRYLYEIESIIWHYVAYTLICMFYRKKLISWIQFQIEFWRVIFVANFESLMINTCSLNTD